MEQTLERTPRALMWTALVLGLLACWVLRPLVVPLIFAAWSAHLLRPAHARLTRALRGRTKAAALLTALLVVGVAGPLVTLAVGLVRGATDLVHAVVTSPSARSALESVGAPRAEQPPPAQGTRSEAQEVRQLAAQHGAQAAPLAKVAGILTVAFALNMFILGWGTFALLCDGPRAYAWLERHGPLPPYALRRLTAAFLETGRGLLASIGLTAATQGVLCTVTYLALGVPRPFVLGFLTAVFAVMPMVGTPLVWGPVALGLALAGHKAKALILVVVGAAVIGVIENFAGPFFARLGRFKLPSFLMVASMFGGVLALGPGGLILGPLVLRLAMEVLELRRQVSEAREAADEGPGDTDQPTAPM